MPSGRQKVPPRRRLSSLIALLLALGLGGCLTRVDRRICMDDVDCRANEHCLFVNPVSGFCEPGERIIAADADAGVTGPDPAGTGGTAELEGSTRTNDTPAQAEALPLSGGNAVLGALDAFDGLRADVDHFSMALSAGTVVELTGEPTGDLDLQLKLTLLPAAEASGGGRGRSVLASAPGFRVRREVFIPAAGKYVLRVEDARNANGVLPAVGSARHTYRVVVRSVTPTPTILALGRSRQRLSYGSTGGSSAGTLPAFRLDVTVPMSLTAETFARQAVGGADPTLYLRGPAQTTVLAAEDLEPTLHHDAWLGAYLRAGTYTLIVDVQQVNLAAPPAFDLSTGFFPPGAEQEPNDDPLRPFPSAPPPTVVTGGLAAPASGLADVDHFKVPLLAGQFVELRLKGRRLLVPRLTVTDPQGIVAETQPNLAGAAETVTQLFVSQTGAYLVRVEDARNALGTAVVGGAGYEYELRVTPLDRNATELGSLEPRATVRAAQQFAAAGAKRWYHFTVAAPGDVVLLTAEPQGSWPVALRVYRASGNALVAEGREGRFAWYLDGGDYWLSVHDLEGRAGSAFTLRAQRVPTGASGDALPPPGESVPPRAWRGAIKASEAHTYVVDLDVGETVSVELLPGAASGAFLDGACTLVAPDERLVASCSPATATRTAQVADVPVPMIGRYTIEVSGVDGSTGSYALYASTQACAAAAGAVPAAERPGALVFNEVLVRAAGDENGDEDFSASADAFVELANTSGETLDLGGVTLRDSDSDRVCDPSGLHRVATFACGTTLPPRGLAVVFGGGTPYGSFGGALVLGSDSPDRCRLHLTPTGETLHLVDRAGMELASFTYPSPALCGGVYCNCQGVSCARNPDGTGPFSLSQGAPATPGLRFDGTAAGPPIAVNDLCEHALPVQPGELLAASPLQATNNYRGSCGVDGRERVYTFTVDALRDVTLEAAGADAVYVRRSCTRLASVELACAATDRLELRELGPGTYYAFVESRQPFTFRMTSTEPTGSVEGDRCGLAIPIALGETLRGQSTVGASDDYRPPLDCGLPAELPGRDVAFVTTLAARQTVEVLVEPRWPFDAAVFITRTCGGLPTPCLAASDRGVTGEPESLRFTAQEAGEYFIVVDSYSLQQQGYFDLTVQEVLGP